MKKIFEIEWEKKELDKYVDCNMSKFLELCLSVFDVKVRELPDEKEWCNCEKPSSSPNNQCFKCQLPIKPTPLVKVEKLPEFESIVDFLYVKRMWDKINKLIDLTCRCHCQDDRVYHDGICDICHLPSMENGE